MAKKKKPDPIVITLLEVDNYMKVTAAHVEPSGNMMVIGGDNANGKTSLLNAIMGTLGGKSNIPPIPITKGADKGGTYIELSNGLRVTLTLKQNGKHKIKVQNEDGMKFDSPQKMLDGLFNHLSFDPLAFANSKAKDQLTTLQELVGIDFTDHDAERAQVFSDRTEVNKRVIRLNGSLQTSTKWDDVPDEKVSVTDLMTALEKLQERNDMKQLTRDALGVMESDIETGQTALDRADELVEQAKLDLNTLKQRKTLALDRLDNQRDLYKKSKVKTDKLKDEDEQPIKDKINSADTINEKITANTKRESIITDRNETEKRAGKMTEQLATLDQKRADIIAAAKMPVDGLDFGPDGILFDGLPFEQASQWQRDLISVSIGLHLNPQSPIVLVREASRWDAKSLEKMGELAKKHNAQVWVETVSHRDQCTLIIEDGTIKS